MGGLKIDFALTVFGAPVVSPLAMPWANPCWLIKYALDSLDKCSTVAKANAVIKCEWNQRPM